MKWKKNRINNDQSNLFWIGWEIQFAKGKIRILFKIDKRGFLNITYEIKDNFFWFFVYLISLKAKENTN